jgi:hypothetical protein
MWPSEMKIGWWKKGADQNTLKRYFAKVYYVISTFNISWLEVRNAKEEVFFGGTEVWTQRFVLPRQLLFLSHASSPKNFFLLFIHLFICAYIVWAIPPPCSPPPSSFPIPLAFRQNLFWPLIQFCWREDISKNKKDIVFLLVEIRIVVQRDS